MSLSNKAENPVHTEINPDVEGFHEADTHETEIQEGEAKLDQGINQGDTGGSDTQDVANPGQPVPDLGKPADLTVGNAPANITLPAAALESFSSMIEYVKNTAEAATGRVFWFGLGKQIKSEKSEDNEAA